MTECKTDKNPAACGEGTCETPVPLVTSRPSYRVDDQETGVSLTVALPGVRKEDLEVSATDEILTIAAKRSDAVPEEWTPRREPATPGRYELRIRLHPTLDPTKIEAVLENGVLRLGIQRREEAVPRSISVN